jgi:hypothetical protein
MGRSRTRIVAPIFAPGRPCAPAGFGKRGREGQSAPRIGAGWQ